MDTKAPNALAAKMLRKPNTVTWKMAPYNDENLYKQEAYVRMLQMQSVVQTYNEA
jgi:hypothetical protein